MNKQQLLSRRTFIENICNRAGQAAAGMAMLQTLSGCRRPDSPPASGNAASAKTPGGAIIPSGARFTDVTAVSGLDFTQSFASCGQHYFVEQVASGAALFDADGDGFLDIYFPQPKPLGVCKTKNPGPLHHRLFINDGQGHFTLKPDAFGGVETDYGISAAVGDYNNDGHADLYVCCYGRNTLFRNRGDDTFEDVTHQAGVGLQGFSTGAVWFDYDNDGHLDLFVCRYCEWDPDKDKPCYLADGRPDVCSPLTYKASTNVLYHNNGDGTFTDVSEKAGIASTQGIGKTERRSLSVAAADFNQDGRLDLFVACDLGFNLLYENRGDGTFEEVAAQSNVTSSPTGKAQANMGVAVGDYDGDGDLDIFVTTFADEPDTLYRNEGSYYTDVSVESGLFQPTLPFLSFGAGFFDARNQGHLDLFIANGHVSPYTIPKAPDCGYKQRNQLMLNDGKGHFMEDRVALPLDDVRVHRGACFGDMNNDGRIDILVTAADDRPTLLRNDSQAGNWLLLRLTNKHGCATPVGTRCIATVNGKKLLRVVLGGGSYGGDSDMRVHFGLDTASSIDTLEITWLSGAKQVFHNVSANQILSLREGQSLSAFPTQATLRVGKK